ncbi:MAG: hypothetical protein E6G34_05665 [Actinobacteria bacterium]|nr:MAG: hypothetical protein E6G34_05665 [Actinomycetota bacterium]
MRQIRPRTRLILGGAMRLLLAALASAALLAAVAPSAGASVFKHNGIIFVHGIEGSGAQFESQAMRFTSNGYPHDRIDEVDYNSTRAVGDKSQVFEQIDAAVAEMKAHTGRKQVDIVAHSLGTSVMYAYLTEGEKAAERKANVGHYINVDGQAENPGVPTLAVWAGRGTPGRHMEGAENVTIPNQTHVQTCTSAESFIQYFKFLRGFAPRNDIRGQKEIHIGGKAVNFPENTGAAGDTLQIWPVNSNGQRMTGTPIFSTEITDGSEGGGAWGPVLVQKKQRYEFAILQPGVGTLHYYYEPFVRSDYTLRLEVSAAIEQETGNRPGASGVVMIRYKEYWGNEPGQNDRLLIDGLNVCTETLCPVKKQVNAYFAYDVNRDGKTELTEDPTLGSLPFLQAADVFIRGATPTDETISFQLESRGALGTVRTLNVPNWESKPVGDGIVVQWNDFEKLTF